MSATVIPGGNCEFCICRLTFSLSALSLGEAALQGEDAVPDIEMGSICGEPEGKDENTAGKQIPIVLTEDLS